MVDVHDVHYAPRLTARARRIGLSLDARVRVTPTADHFCLLMSDRL